MQADQRAKLITTYDLLNTEEKGMLELLSVYYGYCSLTQFGKCLAGLGIKENNKVLKSDAVKQRLKPLLKTGLVEEHAHSGSVRCHRALVEVIARRLWDQGRFELYVESIQRVSVPKDSYYRYSNIDECLQEVRIEMYRGHYEQAKQYLAQGMRLLSGFPFSMDLYLSWFLNPLDLDWYQRHHPLLLNQLAEDAALHQSLYLYQHSDLEDLYQHLLAVDQSGVSNSLLTRFVLELKCLRGEWDFVAQALQGVEEPELCALRAMLMFLQGDLEGAVLLFEQALATFRRETRKRTDYFYGMAGVFYPLAIIKQEDPKRRSKLPALLNSAIKNNGYWADIYSFLAQFEHFLQGDLGLRDLILSGDIIHKINGGFRESGVPDTLRSTPLMAQVLLLVVKSWVKIDYFERIEPFNQKLYSYLEEQGFHWPAAELATIYSAALPSKSSQWSARFLEGRPVTLAGLFASKADWELALDALSRVSSSDKRSEGVVADKPVRLAWLLSYEEQYHRLRIEPREQKQQAKGGWSKGRNVSLKRLAQETTSFDYLTAQDMKICSHIKEYRDSGWYGGSNFFEFDSATPLALVGHPALFWLNAPEVRVEIVKADPELRVKKQSKGDRIRISLEPVPVFEQKLYIDKETPTRLRVIEFTAEHQRIFSVLGREGLLVPMSAQERVLHTLGNISGLLTVHSDIGGSSSNAEQVEADSTPRVHLLPHGEGLRVAMLVRPFNTAGAYFQPGQGGESVLAEIDGKALQAQRDFKLERKRSTEVMDACPSLASVERDVAGEWLLEEPELCLELLLQIQALPEGQALLEWPEGVRFKLLGQQNGSGFNMQVKRDNDWFALQGELKINDETVLNMQQLLEIFDQRQGRFLQLKDGQFIALTDEFRRRLEHLKAYADLSGKKVRLNPLAALTLEDWQDEVGFKADKHWQHHIQRLQAARDYQPAVPSTFQAELRDYQFDGYCWMARLAQWGVGACLADDMGLGKTVQGLALLVDRAPQGPALIVAPTSVCMNWENETHRFAPTLNAIVLGTGDRQKLLDNLQPFDLLICSYGLLQQEQVAEMLAQITFATVILDEAQAIKNVATRRSQGAMALQGGFKIIMTGTPLENHLGELWNLFRFINPGLLGSLEQYNRRFAGPIERDGNAEARYHLKKLIQPFILRRTKTQVLQELPPRTEIPVYVELSAEETAFYEALRRDSLANLAMANDTPGGQKHLQILAAITKLRRSCCNTQLVSPELALPSSKLAAFGEIVDDLLDNKHKALVFSQFVDHLQLIKTYIEQRGIGYQYLDGSTPARERQQRVDAFQRGEGDLFLISLKAGGVGLNLTAADYVIHMDPWWNPAVEDQASDRAHRMGQQRPVTIYRMISKNTIEEKIVSLHGHKRDLADSLLDGADMSGKVSADELLNLMKG